MRQSDPAAAGVWHRAARHDTTTANSSFSQLMQVIVILTIETIYDLLITAVGGQHSVDNIGRDFNVCLNQQFSGRQTNSNRNTKVLLSRPIKFIYQLNLVFAQYVGVFYLQTSLRASCMSVILKYI